MSTTQQSQIKKPTDVNITTHVPFVGGDDGLWKNVKTTIESIRQDIEAFIFTNPGERIMRPTFGCNLRKYLFEPLDSSTLTAIESDIRTGLTNYFPFVQLKSVMVNSPDKDTTLRPNQLRVIVTLNIRNVDDYETVTIDKAIQTLR